MKKTSLLRRLCRVTILVAVAVGVISTVNDLNDSESKWHPYPGN